MKDLGEPLNDAELAEALKILDADANGVVDINEFLNWWRE